MHDHPLSGLEGRTSLLEQKGDLRAQETVALERRRMEAGSATDILILTTSDDYVFRALEAGATGFLL